MQSTDIPQRLQQAFASTAGQRNAIPVTTSTPGQASLVQGFPPETMQPVSAGGVPPDGKDMNGVLWLSTAAIVWAAAAGGLYPFDATYAGLIGGYPKGAVLMMADRTGMWISTTENNSVNPDTTTTTAWRPLVSDGFAPVTVAAGSRVLLPPEYSKRVIYVTGALTANATIVFPAFQDEWIVYNGTTGAFSLTGSSVGGGTTAQLPQGVTTPVIGDATNLSLVTPMATQTIPGISSIATQATVDAGVDDSQFVTSKKIGNGFSFVAAFPGLVKLPSWLGGFMLQWGASAALSTGSQTASGTITFGTPFGTACYWCGGFPDDVAQVSGWNPITCIFNPPSASACNFVADTGGGSAQPITNPDVHIRWLAVGKG